MILDQTLGSTIGAALFGGFADAMYVSSYLIGGRDVDDAESLASP